MNGLKFDSLILDLSRRSRFWLLLGFFLAIVAMFLLASSLDQLDMRPLGVVEVRQQTLDVESAPPAELPPMGEWVERILLILLAICAPVLIISFIFVLVNSQERKAAARDLLPRIIYILILFALLSLTTNRIIEEQLDIGDPFKSRRLPTFTPSSETTSWFAFGITLVFLAIVAAVFWVAWQRLRPKQTPVVHPVTLEMLSLEAMNAIESLRGGGDLRDVIMRCYYEMGQILSLHKGVKRQDWMTPREFETNLLKLGIPRQPVYDLTRLFEQVRYGASRPSRQEEHQAIQCLSEIVRATGGTI